MGGKRGPEPDIGHRTPEKSDLRGVLLKEKILFIHNPSEIFHDMLKGHIENSGFEVVSVFDGSKIIKTCLKVKPLFIILDLTLSGDSWDICKKFRINPDTKKIPLIVLAEKTFKKDMINARKYAVEGYMAKPYNFQVITDMAEKILKKRKAPKSILIVDDDEAILNIVEKNLLFSGYKVTVANNPIKALNIVKDNEFDLLIIDVLLPEINGINFYLKVREFPGKEEIPAVMLSCEGSFEEVRYAYHIGVSEYVAKPFDPLELLEKVRKVLSKSV